MRLSSRALVLPIAIAWVACGETLPAGGGGTDAPVREAGADATDATDAKDGRVPTCFDAPFSEAVHRPDLSSPGDEQSVTLSTDELEVVVGTTRDPATNDYDLWTARRSSIANSFPALVRIEGLKDVWVATRTPR